METTKRGKTVFLMYGEATTSLTVKVPESKKDEIRNKFYDVLKSYEQSAIKEVFIEPTVVVKEKKIKEPYQTKFIPSAVKKIMVNGYACLKDDFSDICYYKDTPTTALVFDDEEHLKEYLIKYKP